MNSIDPSLAGVNRARIPYRTPQLQRIGTDRVAGKTYIAVNESSATTFSPYSLGPS